jgi:protein-ribulosamine 3-kinase
VAFRSLPRYSQVSEHNHLVVTTALTLSSALPDGTTVLRASDHGNCCPWFRTGRIESTCKDGPRVQYFVKVSLMTSHHTFPFTTTQYASGPLGRQLLQAEYESQTKLYNLLPEHVPQPLGWGSLDLLAPLEGHFFLSQFVEFHDPDLPDVKSAVALVAKLHGASAGTSHQFGTPVPLFDGILKYIDGWQPTWPRIFARILFQMCHYNCRTNGLWNDLHAAIVPIIQVVLPRLLNELEKDGRRIEPTFIHGDLWNGNFGLAKDTNKLYMFDSSGYYADHEMEFAYWKTLHHRMHERDDCGAYHRYRPPSEPAKEFEDRVLLYTLKPLLLYSSIYRGHVTRER